MADIYKVYSGDYSKDGYDQGIDDRKENRPKNKFKFFKSVNPINYVWAFNNAFDSFNKNYDRGYLDGQRVEHNVYGSSNQNRGANMQQDNYENHIGMLKDFKENLLALKRHMQVIKEKYKRQIDAMESAGFVEDITIPLRNKYQVFSSKIDEVDRQLAQHEQKIEMQTEALNALRSTARIN